MLDWLLSLTCTHLSLCLHVAYYMQDLIEGIGRNMRRTITFLSLSILENVWGDTSVKNNCKVPSVRDVLCFEMSVKGALLGPLMAF